MSELGNLSQCMMDGDVAANGCARVLRRKALVASLSLEAIVIASVLLWPLVTLGVLSPQLVLTPVPPYQGARDSRPLPHNRGVRQILSRRLVAAPPLYQPPTIPPHIAEDADPEPPGIDVTGDPLLRGDTGPEIPGGDENGRRIEIARPAPENKPRKISRGVMDAMLVHRVQPDYPQIAKMIRLSGTVLLRATLGTDGEVHELEVVSGNAILAQAACAAVRQWRYRPTLLNGQVVEVETQITVNFVLE